MSSDNIKLNAKVNLDKNGYLHFRYKKPDDTDGEGYDKITKELVDVRYGLNHSGKTLQLVGFNVNGTHTKNPLIFARSITPTYKVMFNLNQLEFSVENGENYKPDTIYNYTISNIEDNCIRVRDLSQTLAKQGIKVVYDGSPDTVMIKNISTSTHNTLDIYLLVVTNNTTTDRVSFLANMAEKEKSRNGVFISIGILKKLDMRYCYSDSEIDIRTTLPIINSEEVIEQINTAIEGNLVSYDF